MLWVITENESLQITRCNTFERDGKHQIWVERTNGKTMLLKQHEERGPIDEIKDAIDTAIQHKDPVLDLKGYV